MDEKDKLQQQMAEIGNRYLRRTLGELPRLHELVGQLLAASPADPAGIEEIEQMVHKIHGSGAMFGFDALSERARDVEMQAASRACDEASLRKLEAGLAALDKEVRAAARVRGVE